MRDELNVEVARKELGLSKVAFAKLLGYERHTIDRWEKKEARPSLLARREINRLLAKHRKGAK